MQKKKNQVYILKNVLSHSTQVNVQKLGYCPPLMIGKDCTKAKVHGSPTGDVILNALRFKIKNKKNYFTFLGYPFFME